MNPDFVEFIGILATILGLTIFVAWSFYEVLSWFIEKNSPTRDLVVKSLKKVIVKCTEKNELFQCYNCEKLYRTYQSNLAKEVHGHEQCPHCRHHHWRGHSKRLYEYHKGLDSHPDCPKVNWWNHMKIKNVAKQLRENEKQMELDKFFQEYNKIEIDLSWIENLKKNRE